MVDFNSPNQINYLHTPNLLSTSDTKVSICFSSAVSAKIFMPLKTPFAVTANIRF